MSYEPIAISTESTVVAEYTPEPGDETAYQSEAELERDLIRLLESQAYERLTITREEDLVANLRCQLEALNAIIFTDAEWDRFFKQLCRGTEGIAEKTARIQTAPVEVLRRDDGIEKNIVLLDRSHIHNNRLQVINQYETPRADDANPTGGRHATRYDVTILVNGLPLVHIELKRRGADIREAFNQIDRYQRDSFWAGSGLFEYVQLFIISNGTLTKYYSNTTRDRHIRDNHIQPGVKKRSNSFEFTSWWADAQNRPIQDLRSFAKTFLAKHTLLNILTRYCVFTEDKSLLAMRPYQIVATERILQRIDVATNHRQLGTIDAGGYVWHTTGSGKTLTSFKTAQLASTMPSVDKVLFVVDRKDLDYQTMREYDRFEKGAANSNTSTAVLKRQLENPEARIIITTIQKLATFIRGNRNHPVYDQHVVLIFDECHRSQFGDMHTDITRAFKRYNLFGFTGTPIFAANSTSGGNPWLRTTEQAFGTKLHTYTIVDAITDKNVLPFRIDYVRTLDVGAVVDKQVAAIDTEKALLAPERIREIVRYILDHFGQKTKRSSNYDHSVVTNVAAVSRRRAEEVVQSTRQVQGFNAILATASIDAARRYYNQFRIQMDQLPPHKQLKVGLIYSYGANEASDDGILDEEAFDTDELGDDARSFLEDAIQDYNEMFGTSYDTSADKFQNYYKDLSMRLKNRDLDLVIVVNMFLTGFDATTLNTLFVDKNLRSHGLIQAYSRTNRILNSVKTYGNIVAFRDLEEETNKALELFGNRESRGVVLLKPYGEYHAEYAEKVSHLLASFPLGHPIVGEEMQKEFIQLFGAILRLENILSAFDDFAGNEILTARQSQDYRSLYLDLHAQFRRERDADKEFINDDVVFEIELIKQVEINVDYILMLVAKHRDEFGDGTDREIRAEIRRAVDASPSLRNKRDLIETFVESISPDGEVDEQWLAFIAARREAELATIIREERLHEGRVRSLIEAAFRKGELQTTGTAIARALPKGMSRFDESGARERIKNRVVTRLTEFFDRYHGLGAHPDEETD